MKKHLTLIFLLFFLFVGTGNGAKKYLFSNLSLKDGLSQLTALSIYQDSQGFMWFGTRNGLNRYDGYNFEIFRNNPKNTNSISDNHISAITEDHNGCLWIGTNDGLNRFDLSTNTFIRYFHNPNEPNSLTHSMITSLFIDKKGTLWIGTDSGLNRYRKETNDFESITFDDFFVYNPVNSIAETKDNRLVLGTMYRGVMMLTEQGDEYSCFVYNNKPENPNSLSSNAVRSVFVDSEDNIWIGSIRNGLNFLKNENNKNPSAEFLHFTQKNGLSSNYIRGIGESPKGEIVVGTSSGLNIIEPKDFQIEIYNTYGVNRGDLGHYSIFPVFFDSNQTLWIGTYAGGINYANPYGNKFRNYDIDSELNTITGLTGPMVETLNELYIATEGGGLLRFDKKKETFKQYRLGNNVDYSYSSNILKCLYIDGEKILCGTTVGTVYSFDPKTEKFTLLHELETKNSVYVIQRDKAGNLIIGGVNRIGLLSVSPSGKMRKSFPLLNSETIEFYDVRSFLEIESGIFLVGTRNNGLFLYDENKGIYKQFKKTDEQTDGLPENFVVKLLKDSKGRIWVGTFGGGFSLFNVENESFTTYNSEDGLLNNSICTIVENDDGHLWISTIAGLSDFDTEKLTFTNYTSHNGININEFSFQSGLKTTSGAFFFGGNNGIVSFSPSYLDINPFVPPVVLENLYINNERIIVGSPILEKNLNQTKQIKLKHNQSNISIEYSALNYIFPERNQYSYILEGFDETWNLVENRRRVYYTNIPPGKYIFRVKASNNDGIWNEEGASLQIIISPPYWKTWWAYTLYAFFVLAIIYFIIRYFKVRERLENDIRLKQLEAKTQKEFHEARNRLFTNFSHELRTPLTLIMSPLSEIIENEELQPELKNRMQTMQSNSQRLLRIVNNLMDFQKNESGMLKIRASKSDIIEFIKEMTLIFMEMASARHIDLTFNSSDESIVCLFDKSLMEKVLFNFLSNAIKNTPNGGKIDVSLSRNEKYDMLLVEIIDTGIGISPEDLKKIFVPFYQVSQSEHAHSGTGLGLSLSKSIIELHHGKVWAESDGKNGSAFKFTLPLSETAFQSDEIIPDLEDENAIQYTIETSEEDLQEEATTEIKYTILIVEDNPDVRKYIKISLEKTYNILEANNGEDGLIKAFNYLPDLILTDLMMPKMDGINMCLKLKNDLRTSHIPIIMITARTTPGDIFEGYETGADDYIIKPFNISLLKIRVKNILQSREKLKELYGKKFALKTLGVEAKSLDEKFMQKLYEIIDREIANPDLDISNFYQELGMSRSSLYRKIKTITNLPPGEFIRNFRLETAKKMLKQEGVSISDVYVAVGFNSHSYFSNSFKAAYGVSPTEYAKKTENETSGQQN
jgi:Signal transduction histidine kinase